MRAVILEKFGGPEGLFDGTLPTPQAGPDDVLIRVKAVGFNPTDYQLRQAGHPEIDPPLVLGRDVAGIVEACGANVPVLKQGDAVYA
jgi:NADPH:quinone reductase-like Zn-dependent oxidoreductase